MGLGDALNKAKGLAGDNPDKVEQGIDAATEQVKERTPDQYDSKVDDAAGAARDQLGLGGDDKQQDQGKQG